MKTFSAMCTGDQKITVELYIQKIRSLKAKQHCLIRDNDYQANFIELSKQIERLIELKNAIEVELEAYANS